MEKLVGYSNSILRLIQKHLALRYLSFTIRENWRGPQEDRSLPSYIIK